MNVLESIKEARKASKPRNFTQSWDFCINLKSLDLNKPENRIKGDFPLPNGKGKSGKVAIFADSITNEAKKVANVVITKAEIEKLAKDKKKAKKIANENEWFFGEVTLMPLIGKTWGTILGPRGKVPKPIPPKVKIEPMIKATERMVRVMVKDNPVIHTTVGTEKMNDEEVAKNVEALLNFVTEKLPKGRNNIRSLYLKLSMGKPVKVEMK